MQSSTLPGASAERIARWTARPAQEAELGNACLGIAIGCALSLPIWLGAAALYRLLAA